jgi:hypothetical protein
LRRKLQEFISDYRLAISAQSYGGLTNNISTILEISALKNLHSCLFSQIATIVALSFASFKKNPHFPLAFLKSVWYNLSKLNIWMTLAEPINTEL